MPAFAAVTTESNDDVLRDDDVTTAEAGLHDHCDAEPVEDDATRVGTAPTARVRRWLGFASRNAYVVVIAGAVLVVTRAIDFSPPPEVRVGKANVGQLVGDAPVQEFSNELSNPQAVQVRATLRLYGDNELKVGDSDPELDERGKILSQPVVTTILGMNATVDQTVRLEGGDLEISLGLDATPRLVGTMKKGQPPPEIVLEHELAVHSRRDGWWRNAPTERVHIDTRGFLSKVEEHGHRVVFTVDEHLFSLDLEVHRPLTGPATLARTGG